MSINIPDHFVQSFSTNIQLLQQQKGSRLQHAVSFGTYQGELASPVDQIGAVEATEVTTRFGPMGRVDPTMPRRWVGPRSFELPQHIDKFDKLKTITQPESKYVMNAVNALGRKKDLVIIGAFQGNSQTGVKGAGTTAFPSANYVSVNEGGTQSKMNVEKMLAVREQLMAKHFDFDEEPAFIAITSADDRALLGEIEITSREFNAQEKPVLMDGKLKSFLGFNFIHTELLETLAAGVNEVNLPVWTFSGMHLGMWEDINTSVSIRNDISGEPFQIYVNGTFGGTRLNEDLVYNIKSFRA